MKKKLDKELNKAYGAFNQNHGRLRESLMDSLPDRLPGRTANTTRTIAEVFLRSRITKLAAAAVVILAVYWLAVSYRGEIKQQETNGAVAAEEKTPVELVSAISLNMAFREGDMEAVQKQFEKAEKKTSPGLKERITIEELMCELEECDEI